MNWKDIGYLDKGNDRQRQAFRCLTKLNLFADLAHYCPLLVGTIPIDIDIAESDLDILCEVHDFSRFAEELNNLYGKHSGFRIQNDQIRQGPVTVCQFYYEGFEIELFGQSRPVEKQNGYLHMLIESRLLALAGPQAREDIRKLKKLGYKTEPAFGMFFHLSGDPYAELLTLGELSDAELAKKLRL
ncbi:DUF4269 domain-containing protein [Paenibacillus sp. GCM10027627]|uniref:DUF4269 domain-containing protein n=1 Tax=unclassified Paenibacillus TaxID=185978 RepID=UPI00363FF2AA